MWFDLYVTNPEVLNDSKLFYCEDEELKNYLVKNGLIYVSKKYQDEKVIWIFSRTDELVSKLQKYQIV